jgi:hypothetical protein
VTVQRQLNRRSRIAIAVAVVLLLASPVLALRNCVIGAQEGSQPVASTHPVYDGLVELKNGTTIFLQSRPLAQKVAEWLDLKTDVKPAFQIADDNFASGSAEPTAEGQSQIVQVAQVLKGDPRLRAQILLLTRNSETGNSGLLEQSRASRIRSELLAQDVPASNVTSAVEPAAVLSAYHVIDEGGQESALFVVLSR